MVRLSDVTTEYSHSYTYRKKNCNAAIYHASTSVDALHMTDISNITCQGTISNTGGDHAAQSQETHIFPTKSGFGSRIPPPPFSFLLWPSQWAE